MMKKSVLFIGLFTVGLIVSGTLPRALEASSTPASDRPQAPILKFQTYIFPNEFSVSHPVGWYIMPTKNPPGTEPRALVIIQNLKPQQFGSGRVPPSLIKTDISIESEPFDAAVARLLQGSNSDDSRLIRKGNLTVGGRQALRLWFSQPQVESMVTLVRSNDAETITLVSYYNKANTAAIATIQRLHWSLRVL